MPPKAYAIQASLRTVFHKILAADADDSLVGNRGMILPEHDVNNNTWYSVEYADYTQPRVHCTTFDVCCY